MMKKQYLTSIMAGLLLISLVGTSQAATIFSDNFDGENGGVGVLNYAGFTQWTVTGGTVDLIGIGFHDFQPGNGLYVDMDGSTSNAGIMTRTFSLDTGNYSLSYSLAGSQRGGGDSVKVMLGNFVNVTHTLAGNAPFTVFTQTFSVAAALSADLSFEGIGGDNVGLLLDNVVLSKTAVPLPATLLLLGSGIAGLVGSRIRRKKK